MKSTLRIFGVWVVLTSSLTGGVFVAFSVIQELEVPENYSVLIISVIGGLLGLLTMQMVDEKSPPKVKVKKKRKAGKVTHFISASCQGEKCQICGQTATHKVGEEIAPDDPLPERHNYTSYVCCQHFHMIMGPAVPCPVSE